MMMTSKTPYQVVLPKLGLTMSEAVIVEWHVQNQAYIDEGSPLFAMESDKSLIEIEAPVSGYVTILVSEEETFPVKTPVALISDQAGEPDSRSPQKEEPLQAAADSPQAVKAGGVDLKTDGSGMRASPKARTLARQRGISLRQLGRGSGPRGMIVTRDLEKAAPAAEAVPATPLARSMAAEFGISLEEVPATGSGGGVTRDDLIAHIRQLLTTEPAAPRREPPSAALEGLRGVIANRLTASWNERPQVTLFTAVEAGPLVAARQRLKEQGKKIAYNAFLMAAAARALEHFPDLNNQLVNGELIIRKEINVGLAVDTERGLMVPVLKGADRKTIEEIQLELEDLVERTLAGKLLPDDYSQGTFTVTNLGAFGVDAFSPLINPPETAILGVGKIKAAPVVREGELAVGQQITLSLSFDHRLVDGAPAAEFFQYLCQLLEGSRFYQELSN